MRIGPHTVDVEQTLHDLGLPPRQWGGTYVKVGCPFGDHENDAQKPGLGVLLETGRWQCFKGCGGGGMESLIMRIRNCELAEARRWLLVRGGDVEYGVDAYLLSDSAPEDRYSLEHVFRADYGRQLANKTADYILERGFTPKTLADWGFRYDPDMPAIVIPLFDDTGEHMVGVIRREIPGYPLLDKYMTSPGCKKTRFLFGAWRHPRDTGVVILVEGPLDAVWLHQLGITSAVAVMGASLSPSQLRVLPKLGQTVFIAADNDSAGGELEEQIRQSLRNKMGVVRVKVPEGKNDVQEMSKQELVKLFSGGGELW